MKTWLVYSKLRGNARYAIFNICLFAFLLLPQTNFAQLSSNVDAISLQSLLSSQGGAASLQSGNMSMEEMFYIQQMMSQERGSKSGVNSFFPKKDTSNLFNVADSALGSPLNYPDTMSFVMAIDTIAIDSIRFYEDIEELREIVPDGKRRVVLRKKRVPRDVSKLVRYESRIFKSSNPSMFSNVSSTVGADYPLKAGDELILTIWGAVEKEQQLKINNQGMVNVEAAGMVSLNGATLGSAEGILKTKLSKVYSGLRNGQTFINLRLENLSPIKVFILGEAEKPGAYIFYGNTTVFQALYMAGGPNAEGSARSIQVTRADSSFTVDLYDYLMFGKSTSASVLFDGDIVFLPRAKILAGANGAVSRPAIYELIEGEGIVELLNFAGGLSPDAANQNMVLQRIFEDGRRDFETIGRPDEYIGANDSLSKSGDSASAGGNSFTIKNGDMLTVFKSNEESIQNATILGSVKYAGTYQFKDGMTAADLVKISGGLQRSGYSGRVHILRAIPQGGYEMFSQNLEQKNSIALAPKDTLIVYSSAKMFRMDSVSIGGAVENPGFYPFYEGMDAKDLMLLAGGALPSRKAGVIRIDRANKDGRTIKGVEYNVQDNYDAVDDAEIKLLPWDHIEVPISSEFYRPELVALSGAFKNPGVYTLSHPEETLQELLKRSGEFLDEAYLEGAKFFRRSLIDLNDTATIKLDSTKGLVGIDISKALKKESRNNIKLMNGDSIYVPAKSISVRVSGEVGMVTNVLWKKGEDAGWYVEQAGGFKITGDEDRVMIKYANGSVALASEADLDPDPGAEVIVPYKKPPEGTHWTQYVSAFGTLATATAALLVVLLR